MRINEKWEHTLYTCSFIAFVVALERVSVDITKMVEMWMYLRNGMGNPQVFHNTIVFILYSRSSCSMTYYCIILIMHHFWASLSQGTVKITYCIMHHIFGRFMHYEIQFYVGGKAFGRWHPIWVTIFSADMVMMVIFYTFHQLSVA